MYRALCHAEHADLKRTLNSTCKLKEILKTIGWKTSFQSVPSPTTAAVRPTPVFRIFAGLYAPQTWHILQLYLWCMACGENL